MYDLEQKIRKVGQLSEKIEPNDRNVEGINEEEKDIINEKEKEMTDEERQKIDEEFKEGGDEEKEENAESKCKYPFPVKRSHILCTIRRKLLLKFLPNSI